MLLKLKTCQLNSTSIAINKSESNYMQCNGKAGLKYNKNQFTTHSDNP